MTPPNKKQKTNDAIVLPPEMPPIDFHVLGLAPDVSLKVFDQECSIHSPILKLHSSFFRKNLDLPGADKVAPRFSGDIKYQWVTKLDGPGVKEWHLVARLSDVQLNPLSLPCNKY